MDENSVIMWHDDGDVWEWVHIKDLVGYEKRELWDNGWMVLSFKYGQNVRRGLIHHRFLTFNLQK